MTCTCVSEYQDKKYGKNKRIHNAVKAKDKGRCTVCGKVNG